MMGKNVLLSVVVPVYNVAPYLRKCVDSILCQTYRNLELILVDDGSADGSAEICEEYAAMDSRVKFLRQPHEGVTPARKAGVMAAAGDYIAWVDSDDWIDPDAYEKLFAFMAPHFPDILIYGFNQEYQDRTYICQCSIPVGYYDANGIKNEIYPHLLKTQYIDQQVLFSGCNSNAGMDGKQCVKKRRRQQEIYSCVGSYLIRGDLLKKTQSMVPNVTTMGEDLVCIIYNLLFAKSVMVTDLAPYHYQKRDDSSSTHIISFQPYQTMFDAACEALRNSPMRDVHIMQLCEVMLDYMLMMRFEMFLEDALSELPFGKLDGCRVALYGAGKFGQEVYRKTKAAFPDRITLWVDRNYGAYQKAGLPVEPVETLLEEPFDVVAVALLDESICEEIKQDLTAMGISLEKIRYVTVSTEILEAVKEILSKNAQSLPG